MARTAPSHGANRGSIPLEATIQHLPMKNIQESPDNKAVRELLDEIKDLNKTFKKTSKTNEIFSIVLIVFAVVQIITAIFQYTFSIFGSKNNWEGLIFTLPIIIIMFFAIKFFLKILRKD